MTLPEFLESRGISNADLARMLSVSRARIGQMLRSWENLQGETLKKITKVVPVRFVITRQNMRCEFDQLKTWSVVKLKRKYGVQTGNGEGKEVLSTHFTYQEAIEARDRVNSKIRF